MKNKIWLASLIVMGFLFIIINSCKKEVKIPGLFTTEVSGVTTTTAFCGGYITSVEDKNTGITERGVCWSTSQEPTINDNKTSNGNEYGSFTSQITGLSQNTTYYVKAYATNSGGTGYGNTISFTTLPGNPTTVTDYDGNTYKTVTIGTQVWMAENLKVMHYRDGSAITYEPDNTAWVNLTTGARCSYDNLPLNLTFGMLYNWYAVHDIRNIAPAGWHVPTEADWNILSNYLGGESIAGGKLKEADTSHWSTPNTGATDQYGFNALPTGIRNSYDGSYTGNGLSCVFWSSTESSTNNAGYRILSNINSELKPWTYLKVMGNNIRCVKD